jgi:hypothetical protein
VILVRIVGEFRQGTGSKTSGALLELDIGSYVETGWGKWEEGGSGILVKSIVKVELGHFGAEV